MDIQKREQLSRIVISGFKSIKYCDIDLRSINVLIGANGSGKSNFISVFEMLQRVLERELALYTGKKGISSVLYNGKESTDSITVELHFGDFVYSYELEWTDNDSLQFRAESFCVSGKELLGGAGHRESILLDALQKVWQDTNIPQMIANPGWRVYQFHNTSLSSRMKSEHNIANCKYLMGDASNLAAFLYRLRERFPKEYQKIVKTVQRVAPFFKDFELEPREHNNEQIVLRWRQRDYDGILMPSQLSDGTLRYICLATLLLQPLQLQPDVLIIDEPELGLHPYAITMLAELVKKASANKQIILATQSVELLDHFEAEDVIVVDKSDDGSVFRRLDSGELAAWLDDDYSLGELWNKNIIGGRVTR